MANARQEDDPYRRVEMIAGSPAAAMDGRGEGLVAESFEEVRTSEVARRNGVARGLLTAWRRQIATAVVGRVPIQIGAESGGGTSGESERLSLAPMRSLEIAAPPAEGCGVAEIEVSGARVRIEMGVELATLLTVLSALRGIR
jgi:transposase